MLEDVKKRLDQLGVKVEEKDEWGLQFVISKVLADILADINHKKLPEELKPVAIDMVAGEFLLSKKQSGQLDGIDLSPVMKQWSEGDSSITFAIGDGSLTPEQRLDALIAHLCNSGRRQLTCYRRLRW